MGEMAQLSSTICRMVMRLRRPTDGKQIAFALYVDGQEIFVMNADDERAARHRYSGNNSFPVWRP
ncbi:MAG: hypothetical protein QM771_07205 [Nitrospira sp.]